LLSSPQKTDHILHTHTHTTSDSTHFRELTVKPLKLRVNIKNDFGSLETVAGVVHA